jgi:hypothetical protein
MCGLTRIQDDEVTSGYQPPRRALFRLHPQNPKDDVGNESLTAADKELEAGTLGPGGLAM